MSDWLTHLKKEIALNPGKPLKEVIEIARLTIHNKPTNHSKNHSKNNRKNNSKNNRKNKNKNKNTSKNKNYE